MKSTFPSISILILYLKWTRAMLELRYTIINLPTFLVTYYYSSFNYSLKTTKQLISSVIIKADILILEILVKLLWHEQLFKVTSWKWSSQVVLWYPWSLSNQVNNTAIGTRMIQRYDLVFICAKRVYVIHTYRLGKTIYLLSSENSFSIRTWVMQYI